MQNKKRTMVVKFNNYKVKQAVMSTKSELKKSDETKSIFINDYLSKETLSLFKHAKSLHSVGFTSVYVRSGNIFVKRSGIARPKLIKTFDDVDELLLQATNYQKRRSVNPEDADNDRENDTQASFLSPN